ncbi:MAG: thioredoxin fold domain-containing protein [Sedimentisphaerales bacterium]|nr:thioredoxin fold domain-containing protein [Sedimentisphaerales bacterium]
MKNYHLYIVSCLILFSIFVPIYAGEKNPPGDASISPSGQPTVNDAYPGLTNGVMAYARSSELPEGMILRAGKVVIQDNELAEEIAKTPEQMRPKLEKNAIFILEQVATLKLLLVEAKADAAKKGTDILKKEEKTIIQDYLQTLVKTVKVPDSEIFEFYNDNKEMFGSASLTQVKPQIDQFLLQQKQQELVNNHIRTIGQRIQIEISAPWLEKYAVLARDNPVDKARVSGKPSLVDFGSVGCVPCDMMAPMLDRLREKYKGKIDVLFIHVGQEPILASRYGVQSIPVQIFFNKTGKEVFRHTGFFPEEEIEKQLSKIGVK